MGDYINGKPRVKVRLGKPPHKNRYLFKEEYEKVLVGEQHPGDVQKKLGISKQTYYNWALEYENSQISKP